MPSHATSEPLLKPFASVEAVWAEMDRVWTNLGCHSLEPDKLEAFYQHPVWEQNSQFVQQDPESMGHRRAIARYLANHIPAARVLDFGGGFGTLAREIHLADSESRVDVFEPSPSAAMSDRLAKIPGSRLVRASPVNTYDGVVCIDVLEHLLTPLTALRNLVEATKVGGILIFANCFFPVIQCHLPSTFYLRFGFTPIARLHGLRRIGRCHGSHAIVYKKVSEGIASNEEIERRARFFQKLFPLLDLFSRAKDLVRKAVGVRTLFPKR